MSWTHIQQIMEDIGGSAIIVEDGEPRYVVVPIKNWQTKQSSGLHHHDENGIEYEEVSNDSESPFDASPTTEAFYEESPVEGLDTFDSPSYPV